MEYDDAEGKYRAENVTGGKSSGGGKWENTYGGGGAGGGGRACYNCGEVGHISRECDNISLDDPARHGSKSYKGRQGGQGGQGKGGMEDDEKHTGMVRSWKADRGFGFIAPDRGNGGEEIFCHISSIVDGKLVKVRSAGRERGN